MSKVSGESEQGKRNKQVRCDAGCGEVFALEKMNVEQLGDGVEKVFFVCPHCGKEYVCFYADAEIRELQEQIRDVDRLAVKVARGNGRVVTYEQLHEGHEKLRRQIDRKMAALRARVEGEKNGED